MGERRDNSMGLVGARIELLKLNIFLTQKSPIGGMPAVMLDWHAHSIP